VVQREYYFNKNYSSRIFVLIYIGEKGIMRKDGVTFSKSSFLGMAKDTSLIMNRILSNNTLLKLIYHTSRNWEKEPNLNSE
jgi:hypothetical protein